MAPGNLFARRTVDREALHSSNSNEWYTPARYADAAREVMGGIDLDPASCETANATIRAERIFTITDDGLRQRWHGRVFLNPPYGKSNGKSNQAQWITKLLWEHYHGEVSQAVLLVNAVPSNKWFDALWAFPICFTDHRIRFVSPTGEHNAPTHSNCFAYLGPESQHRRFADVFRKFGNVVLPNGVVRAA